MVELFTKYGEGKVKESVFQFHDLLEPSCLGEMEYLHLLTNLNVERSASQVLDISIQLFSLPVLMNLLRTIIYIGFYTRVQAWMLSQVGKGMSFQTYL